MYVSIRRCLLNYPVAIVKRSARKYSVPAVTSSSNSEVEYPPILDLSYRSKRRRVKDDWHKKIEKLNTVEEKLYGINMPQYYGWKSLQLTENRIVYNSLPQAQYITRTHLMENHTLPDYYNNLISSEELDTMVQMVKGQIEDSINFEFNNRLRTQELSKDVLMDTPQFENIIANAVMFQINRILLNNLNSKYPHLLENEVDFEPRIEAFWFAGGIEPPPLRRKHLESMSKLKEYANDPVDLPVRYVGSPILNLRHRFPLSEFMPLKDSENSELQIPVCKLDPRTLGYSIARKNGTNIPGFWPGDPSEFGHLSYHNRGYLWKRPVRADDTLDALAVQAIYASYSWLLSLSCYQGFRGQFGNQLTWLPGCSRVGDWSESDVSPTSQLAFDTQYQSSYETLMKSTAMLAKHRIYSNQQRGSNPEGFSTFHDVTYPLVTQTVISNGQWWSFSAYQLNTLLLHSEYADENPRRNICWMTKPMALFEKFEDDKIHGFNDDVLRTLLKFYVNVPKERANVNMKPYLGETEKLITDITDDKRRVWLEQHYKHLMANRPRHWQTAELYHWQKIYHIDHNSRPLLKMRDLRPQRVSRKVANRRMDDHLPPYIPRCLREKPNKRKYGRWAKSYYPDA